MKVERYVEVFKILQDIKSRRSIELEANLFLSISKPTPENLAKYEGASPRFAIIHEIANLIFYSGQTFLALFKSSLNFRRRDCTSTEHRKSIFLSHFFESTKNRPNNLDQFFGRLPEFSRESGLASKMLYIDQEGDSFRAKTISDLSGCTYKIVGVHGLEFDYISLFFKNFTLALRMFIAGLKIQNKDYRSIHLRAAVNQVSKATFRNLILAKEITWEIKSGDVDEVWLTLEGHAYERAIISAIVADGLNVKINVYQHAAITPHQKGIFDLLHDFGNHVHVFTSGVITYRYFELYFPSLAGNMRIAGSGKAVQEGSEICFSDTGNRQSLLIVPEGTTESVLSMVGFAIECSMLRTSTKIVIRFHPNTPHDALETARKLLAKYNIEISAKELIEDFKLSFACVYRSSAAVIQSLAYGVLPVYFGSEDEFDLDCLATTNLKYPRVHSPISLMELLSASKFHSSSELFSPDHELMNFSRNYFMPWVNTYQ